MKEPIVTPTEMPKGYVSSSTEMHYDYIHYIYVKTFVTLPSAEISFLFYIVLFVIELTNLKKEPPCEYKDYNGFKEMT